MLVPSQPANATVVTSINNKRWCQVDLPTPRSWPLLIDVYVKIQCTNYTVSFDTVYRMIHCPYTVNKGRAWKTPSCICSCQLFIKLEVCYSDCWKLWRVVDEARNMTENALSILLFFPYNSNKPRSQTESCLFSSTGGQLMLNP